MDLPKGLITIISTYKKKKKDAKCGVKLKPQGVKADCLFEAAFLPVSAEKQAMCF